MQNSFLLDYVGKTETESLLQEVKNNYAEKFNKLFPNYFNEKSGIVAKACSIVTVTKEKEIKAIGMSCIDDLLTDNFGVFLASIIGMQNFSQNDLSNVARGFTCIHPDSGYNSVNVGGLRSLLRVGTGNTPATRQDFNIESPFSNGGAEDSAFNVIGQAGYNSGLGQISFSGSITAFGAGGIQESILIQRWRDTGGTTRDLLYSRDNISPIVTFIAGETINLSYILLLS